MMTDVSSHSVGNLGFSQMTLGLWLMHSGPAVNRSAAESRLSPREANLQKRF